jgi:apolipoprotein N-acyltransferase
MKNIDLKPHTFSRFLTQGHKRFFWVGFFASLAWAPYHYVVFLCASLCVLMIRIEACDCPQQAFRCGWWWGWGFYVATLFWAGNSLLIDGERFGWLWPFSVLGLPGVFAFYPAVTTAFISLCYKRLSLTLFGYSVCFAISWSLYEYLQGHLFTGFPWNLTAYIWAPYLPVAQSVAVVGSYGLGLITLFLFSLVGGAILRQWSWKSLVCGALINGIALSLVGGLGYHRLKQHPTLFHDTVWLRLVQPNFDQREKLDPRYGPEHFQKLVDLSTTQNAQRKPSHVIWAEGSFPWSLSSATLSLVPTVYEEGYPFILLLGCTYQNDKGDPFNSLLSFDSKGVLRPVYAKTHLLPFGEYIPCRSVLSLFVPGHWLKTISPGQSDIVPGPRAYTTECEGLPPFRSLICYEAVFPRTVRSPDKEKRVSPEWILNITNDGWFGYSPGPYQHFVSAQFRAIEEGLPLVRVANTGISAIIDPLGRVLYSLPLDVEGFVEGKLPKALTPSFYSIYGETLWIIGILALGAVGVVLRKKKKQ